MSTETGLYVTSVERIDETDIIVEFSDSSSARYTPQELADLRPDRKVAKSPGPGIEDGHDREK